MMIPEMDEAPMDGVKTFSPAADRILRLIEMLMAEPDGMLPSDLLDHLDMSRSTLFALLKTLKDQGYIEQAEPRGRYRLGPKLQAWRSAPSPASQDLLAVFYQETSQISLEETLGLVLLSSEGPYLLAQLEGTQTVRCVFSAGMVYPDLNAARQVLTAYPEREIQQNGYSLQQRGEVIDLAVPVCRDGVRPDAVLVLSAPVFRWKPEALASRFIDEVRGMAARISLRLGAQFYSPYYSHTPLTITRGEGMTVEEIDRFLQGPWTARLACVRPDGFPHIITLWQEWDGSTFLVIAWKGSQWGEFLVQNASVSLTVDEPFPPFRRVVVDGSASALDSQENTTILDTLLQRLARRYIGQEIPGLSEQVGQAFRICPDRMRGMHGLPDFFDSQPE